MDIGVSFPELPSNTVMTEVIIHPVLLKVSLKVHSSRLLKAYRIVLGLVITVSFPQIFLAMHQAGHTDIMPLTLQGNHNPQRELKVHPYVFNVYFGGIIVYLIKSFKYLDNILWPSRCFFRSGLIFWVC